MKELGGVLLQFKQRLGNCGVLRKRSKSQLLNTHSYLQTTDKCACHTEPGALCILVLLHPNNNKTCRWSAQGSAICFLGTLRVAAGPQPQGHGAGSVQQPQPHVSVPCCSPWLCISSCPLLTCSGHTEPIWRTGFIALLKAFSAGQRVRGSAHLRHS